MPAHLNNQSLCLGFEGRGEKKSYDSISERSKMPIPSMLRNVEISLQKDSFCFSSILARVEVNQHYSKQGNTSAKQNLQICNLYQQRYIPSCSSKTLPLRTEYFHTPATQTPETQPTFPDFYNKECHQLPASSGMQYYSNHA